MTIEGGYTAEVLGVARGGLRRGATYQALADAAVVVDLGKFSGGPGAPVLRVSGLFPHGGDFSGRRLGDLQGASNIAAAHAAQLYEFSLAGTAAEGRLTWLLGRIVADGDFATTEAGAVFLNSSFGWPAFISANTRNTGPAFNRSALGAQGAWALAPGLALRAGVYDGDTFDDPEGDPARHRHGLATKLGGGQGAFALAELARTWTVGAEGRARPGALKLGLWRHSADFADQTDPARAHRGNGGAYLVAEQMLWREAHPGTTVAPQGLAAFARFGGSRADRNRLSRAADAGLSYTGLLPGRPKDRLALGAAWARVSGAARRAERVAGAAVVPDVELALELIYEIAATPRWRLAPDVQWIRHPGGSAAVPDALVFGLRSSVGW